MEKRNISPAECCSAAEKREIWTETTPGTNAMLKNVMTRARNQSRRATDCMAAGAWLPGAWPPGGGAARGGAGLRRGSLTCGLGGPGAVRKFRKWVAVMVAHTTNWLRCKLTVRVLYYHKNDYNCSENVTFVSLVSFTAETGNSIV